MGTLGNLESSAKSPFLVDDSSRRSHPQADGEAGFLNRWRSNDIRTPSAFARTRDGFSGFAIGSDTPHDDIKNIFRADKTYLIGCAYPLASSLLR
jgi:hypothetical protein